MEKQISMYDYLNNDKVAVMNTAPVEEAVEKIEAEPVDYNTLNKAELITVIADKDNVINNYMDKIEHMEKEHKIVKILPGSRLTEIVRDNQNDTED